MIAGRRPGDQRLMLLLAPPRTTQAMPRLRIPWLLLEVTRWRSTQIPWLRTLWLWMTQVPWLPLLHLRPRRILAQVVVVVLAAQNAVVHRMVVVRVEAQNGLPCHAVVVVVVVVVDVVGAQRDHLPFLHVFAVAGVHVWARGPALAWTSREFRRWPGHRVSFGVAAADCRFL